MHATRKQVNLSPKIDPSRVRVPGYNHAYVESFNGRDCDECLNQHSFRKYHYARALIEGWRADYNQLRPHTSLDGQSPEEFIHSLAGRTRPARPNAPRQLELFEENSTVRRLS